MNLIIIGGGSSIRKFPSLWDDIIGCDVMVINYSYKFVKKPPKYLVSADRKFLKNNKLEIEKLSSSGVKIITRTNVNASLFAGKPTITPPGKLSGIFALSYATQKLNYDKIYLFGYDFGPRNGKIHFYDNINHSGINKDGTYLDENKNIRKEVENFNIFKNYNITIVGDSNIKSFRKISYKHFIKEIV